MKPAAILVAAALSLSFAASLAFAQEAASAAPRPKPGDPAHMEKARLPWTPATSGYIRRWLVCGAFPSPQARPQAEAARQPLSEGYDTDFLAALGGEAAARPGAGQAVARPDGSEAAWTEYESPVDAVDLMAALTGQTSLTYCVAYAYATVHRDEAGDAVLALGSDDSVKVYVNGALVHDHMVARAVTKDEDLVPVTFAQGENALLLKVENLVGGWGFAVRVLEPGQALSTDRSRMTLEAVSWPDEGSSLAVLRTDPWPGGGPAMPVTIEARAPGGRVMANVEAPRGEQVTVDTAGWPEGPYEFRAISPSPLGRPVCAFLDWYKGDWLAQARELLDQADAVAPDSADPGDLRLGVLAEIVLDTLGADPRQEFAEGERPASFGAGNWRSVISPLMEHRELQVEPTDGPARLNFLRLAWRDEVDGSAQFARAYLPFDYDPAQKWPLAIMLHGYHPENPRYIHWWGVWSRHHGFADPYGMIVVEPHGRGNTTYAGIGDADVLRAISEARAAFSVDDGRTYLIGYSMGGAGTWNVGSRHPDLFAAIVPVYGGWDPRAYTPDEDLAKLSRWQALLYENAGTYTQIEALLTTPMLVDHGDADTSVPVGNSRYVVGMLQRWGYPVRYWEHPGLGHASLGDDAQVAAWMLQHRLERNPRHVRVRAVQLKQASAHWVRVGQREDPFAVINVDAEVLDPRTIILNSENALQITLSPGPALVDPEAPVSITWNSRPAGEHRFADGPATLRAPGYEPGPLVKRPELAGPCEDVQTTPSAVVVGTASDDPLMRRFCRLDADRLCESWRQWQHTDPRCFLDTEITDDQIGRYSLILVGGPDENLITRRLSSRIPLKIEREAITVAGRRWEAPDSAVMLAYPHPLNADRYVCVRAANSPAAMYFASRLPSRYDFAISDPRTQQTEADTEKTCVAVGFLDAGWGYNEDYVFAGDPEARAQQPVRRPPVYVDAAQPGERLMLSELIETRMGGTFNLVERDLSWARKPLTLAGRTYDSGLGVQLLGDEPSFVEYDLGEAGWTHLRATLGIEADQSEGITQEQRAATGVQFIVRGDGVELYRSATVGVDSQPVEMDVDVTGVRTLRLEVAGSPRWGSAASSVDWADVRLER